MSYKSRETGYQKETFSMSAQEFYRKNEPPRSIIATIKNGKIKVINTERKSNYNDNDESITRYIINRVQFILLELSNQNYSNYYDLLINMSMFYTKSSEHRTGNIGKTFAMQLKDLFFGMITASSNEVQLYIDCFNKLTKFIKTCSQQYPQDFLSIKQACSKQAPEDILQVILIDIILDWNLINEEQMLQLIVLAINRNYTYIRRQMQNVTPENYNIVLGLP